MRVRSQPSTSSTKAPERHVPSCGQKTPVSCCVSATHVSTSWLASRSARSERRRLRYASQRPACTFLAYCFFHAWATFEGDEAGTSTRRTRSKASLGEAPTVRHPFR